MPHHVVLQQHNVIRCNAAGFPLTDPLVRSCIRMLAIARCMPSSFGHSTQGPFRQGHVEPDLNQLDSHCLVRSFVRPHLRLLPLHADHTHRLSPTVTPTSTSTWVVFMLPERVSPRVPAPTSALPPRGSRPTRPTWRTRSAVWPKRV